MIPEAPLRFAIIMCASIRNRAGDGKSLTQVCDIVELSSRQSFIATYMRAVSSKASGTGARTEGNHDWQPDMDLEKIHRECAGVQLDLGKKAKALIPTKTPTKTPGVRGHAVSCPCRQHQPATSYDTQNTICLQHGRYPHSHGPIVSNTYRYLDLRTSPCRHFTIYSRVGAIVP